jgi:LysM repeat protein
MLKKSSLIFVVALAILLLMAACQRSASQAPLPATETPTGPVVLEPTPTGMGAVQLIGTTQMIQTMTAMATNPIAYLPTTTPITTEGTPGTFTLVPPTGSATTPDAGTTPVVIVATSTPGHPSSYTLMSGEYPYCIARRFNVNQNELLTLNNLSSSALLQPDFVLLIPQSGNPFVGERTLHTHPGSYTVSSAQETVYKVACYFGDVDPSQIIAANALVSPYTLHINQVLSIP